MSQTTLPSLMDRLAQTNPTMNAPALVLWANFIDIVVVALGRAHEKLRDPNYVRRYQARAGWWKKKKQKNQSKVLVSLPAEDAITDALVDVLEEVRAEAAADDPINKENIAFASQQPRKRQKRIGPMALTTDIRAFVPGSTGLDLRIEAKLLFALSDIATEYCSEKGIRRFCDADHPYTEQVVGAMLGYTLTPLSWRDAVAAALTAVEDISDVEVVRVATEGDALICVASRLDGAVIKKTTILNLTLDFDTSPSSHH